MKTINVLGLADHGRQVSDEEFDDAEFEQGYLYELIEGRLCVLAMPNPPENDLEEWLGYKLRVYSHQAPEVINKVTAKARVFVPGRPGTTAPDPDIAAYRNYPFHLPARARSWRNVSPILVAEVLVDSDPHKDLVRNVELYLQVPTIREYWILDGRDDPDEPTMIVRRRRGRVWLRPRKFGFGETYTTPLLPSFYLIVDPRR
ncbi:MAG TPA: Uma2 family endonuclease [Gemmataceae bacterium]|nr:Uma2 family endonuclease [Gemmataceae bacterium]